MSKIKAVIFDMDGVLIDARDWHYEALNRALGLFGYSISRHDHLVTFDGLPTRKKLELLTRERGLPAALHAFINDLKQNYTSELVHRHCRPCFAHEYALARLRADGYRLAVASNSIRASIELMMERSALGGQLDLIVSNQDVAVGKPDPAIYLKAIAGLGVTAGETLVVEDNPNGIAAARAAGAHLMVVGGPPEVTYEHIRRNIDRAEGQP